MSCELCEGHGPSCVVTHIKVENRWVRRLPAKIKCDCGADEGGLHHYDCINETCPVCKGLFCFCSCAPALVEYGVQNG